MQYKGMDQGYKYSERQRKTVASTSAKQSTSSATRL